jgi:Na+-translocating ferredoxin:NAD+ oxidoreductase RnfD subunit
MTANWAFAPVCGADFWRVIVTSPEVLIFLFFMITDPKTVPGGAVGRVVFGFLVAVASTLLLAPMTDEFGTKVALLSGLVAVCAARPIVDRLVPAPKSTG